MKCLIIDGCPKKGNTWEIVKIVKDRMQKHGEVEFDEVVLSKLNLPMCLGCGNCIVKGEDKCPHADIIQPVAKQIEDADCVIFTSPCYSLDVTATCKNFIDHMSYNFHRPRFFKKKMLAISTTAGAGSKGVVKYLRDVLKHWGFNTGYKLAFAVASAGRYVPTQKAIKKTEKVADKFYKDVASGKLHSPTLKRVAMYNIWRVSAKLGKYDESADTRYWTDSKLCDYPFSPEVKTGFFKKAFGNFFNAMIIKAMKK